MIQICSFCKISFGETEPLEDKRETHGMCPPCHKWFTEQLEFDSISDFLETFKLPVIIVNEHVQVVSMNKEAEMVLGKPSETTQGLLSGDAMECVYARLPEGCGNTAHCPACTIRNLVHKTLEQEHGQTHHVLLVQEEETISFFAETSYLNGMISIQLNSFN